MQYDDKHNANAVPLPPDEACNADPAHACPDLEGGEGEVVIGHGILAGTYLAEYRDSLK